MIMLALTGATTYKGVFLFLGLPSIAGFLPGWISVLLIFVPIFVPIVIKLGFDPLWFSILFLVVIQTSYSTPRMAPAIFYLKGIVPPEERVTNMFSGVVPCIALQLIRIGIIMVFYYTFCPEIKIEVQRLGD